MTAPHPSPAPTPHPARSIWRTWILGALLPIYLITTFLGALARVDGDSMHPTLNTGDVILLLKYPRWLHAWKVTPTAHPYPQRGDILIFKAPADSEYAYETKYGLRHRPYNIKRVIALPGDTIAIQGGKLILNGHPIAEPYASEGFMQDQEPQNIPANHVWVIGDNRQQGSSLDSRVYGPVDLKDVAGPANLRLWPGTGMVDGGAP